MMLRSAVALLTVLSGFGAVRAQSSGAVDACATAPQTCATTISTRAVATRRIPNSAVDVSAGITATDKQLAEVQRELAQQTASLLAYLRQQKVERLMTNAVNVSPQTEQEKNGHMRIVGYTGTSSIAFRTTPAKAPEILTGVLVNGGNSIESTEFTATEEEVRAAQRELSAEAVRTAIAQADAMAKAANMHVVAVKSLIVGTDGGFDRLQTFTRLATPLNGRVAAAPIDTAAGEQEITVGVDVVVAARP